VSASEPPNASDAWIEVAPGRWKREYACSAEELAAAKELEEARVAEHEVEFLALLRAMLGRLMDAYEVESVAELPHAHELVRRAVEECAVEKRISHEVAVEIARRDLGFPESADG
jgi:hypothetical protein